MVLWKFQFKFYYGIYEKIKQKQLRFYFIYYLQYVEKKKANVNIKRKNIHNKQELQNCSNKVILPYPPIANLCPRYHHHHQASLGSQKGYKKHNPTPSFFFLSFSDSPTVKTKITHTLTTPKNYTFTATTNKTISSQSLPYL